jgi:N-formylglutamate deformylase
MELYRYFPGKLPVLVSVPHCGTHVPEAIRARLTGQAQALPDTDWHVDRLYDFARAMGVHLLAATHSRYVADLNRAPDDASLYPGRFTTGLCPLTDFNAVPLYRPGAAPDEAEVRQRIDAYWQPYHRRLRETLAELRNGNERVVLFDAHSIRSQVPRLFDGVLPDFNFGTGGSMSCDPALARSLLEIGKASAYSSVLDGRFTGGYITRHYGAPAQGIHALQLELAQVNYMDEDSFAFDEAKAAKLQGTLRLVVEELIRFACA